MALDNLVQGTATSGDLTSVASDAGAGRRGYSFYDSVRGIEKGIKRGYRKAKAFTLIELLTVIAIIGVTAAALLPVLGRTRTKARVAAEETFQQKFSEGVENYWDDSDPHKYLDTSWGPGYRIDTNSIQKAMGYRLERWKDPFRDTVQSANSVIAALGFSDSNFPPSGKGRIFLNFVEKDSTGTKYVLTGGGADPIISLNGVWPNLHIPTNTLYMTISAGPDGVIDMDPRKDIIYVRDDTDARAHKHVY